MIILQDSLQRNWWNWCVFVSIVACDFYVLLWTKRLPFYAQPAQKCVKL